MALSRGDLVIFMGGLGPTEDDLTREAVAEVLGLQLHRDDELLAKLEKRFAKHRIKMSPNNAKQADILPGAVVLPNSLGTAPGQWLAGNFDDQEKIVLLLPGPPHELKRVFEEECMARLRAKLPPSFIATRVLKVAMMPESECDARVAPIYKGYPDVETTILAGAVVYSNDLKTDFADVPAELIEKHGAVSKQVAAALAGGIRKRCKAALGIGITGVAGPTGGTEEKPVGLVFHALAGEGSTDVV